MKIKELTDRYNLPKQTYQALENRGITKLNQMQEKAIEEGLLKEGSYVVSAPTSSGKTLLAELLSIKKTVQEGSKALYICPLRALATEQYRNFKKKYSKIGLKTALSIGDYDEQDSKLKNYDLIISSYEKADSLIRHEPEWLEDLDLLIVDEIQNIDSDRGPTLEVLISKIKKIRSETEIIALSATVPNPDQIANWIGGEPIRSSYRPVPLYEGIYHDGVIRFKDRENRSIDKRADKELSQLIKETLSNKEQSIVFSNTRRNCESNAEKVSKITERHVDKPKLREISKKVKNALPKPTEQCKKLSKLVKRGTAFHHAGLVRKQRREVEKAYEKGLIKVIVATPTLAAGINLPTKRVIMNSMYMYKGKGTEPISTNRYTQRAGRAGRPQYDDYGESIIIARRDKEVEQFKERYLEGSLNPTESKLGSEPVLRSHVLSVICDLCRKRQSLNKFFSKTFYGQTYGSESQLSSLLEEVTSDLEQWGFITIDEQNIEPTTTGKRVSELYIDPLSAKRIIESLENTEAPGETGYLFMASDTEEMRPYLKVKRREEPQLWEEARANEDRLMRDITGFDLGVNFLNKYKLTKMLKDWVSEKDEDKITEEYGVPPGIIRGYLKNADWVIYSAEELAKLTGNQEHIKNIKNIRKRLKYGIEKELIPLTDIKGIGRVRARKLYKNQIKKPTGIKRTSYPKLSEILGPKTAKKIKERLGQDIEADPHQEKDRYSGQKTISEY